MRSFGLELQVDSLAVLDVQGFPVMLNWYMVHRKNKRLPPVAIAFKNFLMNDGAALIEKITRFKPKPGARFKGGSRTKDSR